MEKLLLVEDDVSLSRGIEFALTKEDWQVSCAGTIREAAQLMGKERYSLILLDVMLPDGNGFELCKSIRSKSDVPIIFLTACDEEVNIILGLDIGGDDYITKPFRVRELISRIRSALRRSGLSHGEPEQTRVLRSGDLKLDLLELKLFKKYNEMILTPIEFRLLAVFMQNPLQVLFRDRILEKLWAGDGEFIDPNTLSVYIRRLREKIEDNPSEPQYITTLRGFGYKWNIPVE